MSKKMCPICGDKAGLLGTNIANDQRICSGCWMASLPYMKENSRETAADTWTIEDVKLALKKGAEMQSDTQGSDGDLLIVSTDFITDKNLQTISVVSGSRFVFTGVIGEGDINRAIADMKRLALNLNADAVIGFRYAPSNNHAYVWGTAVKYI